MMRIATTAGLFALALSTTHAYAQRSDAPGSGQPPATNGVIMQTIQPASIRGDAQQISSLVWIYDTNLKQMMLCSSRTDGNFSCTQAVRLTW